MQRRNNLIIGNRRVNRRAWYKFNVASGHCGMAYVGRRSDGSHLLMSVNAKMRDNLTKKHHYANWYNEMARDIRDQWPDTYSRDQSY